VTFHEKSPPETVKISKRYHDTRGRANPWNINTWIELKFLWIFTIYRIMQSLCSPYHAINFTNGTQSSRYFNEILWRLRRIDETEEKIWEGKKCVTGTEWGTICAGSNIDQIDDDDIESSFSVSYVVWSRKFISQFEYSPKINPFRPNGFVIATHCVLA